MSNLVENSLQAKATLVTIDVQFDLLNIVLIVSDNGPGFPESVLQAHVNNISLSLTGGNGLGLLNISKILKKSGGRLDIKNDNLGGYVKIVIPYISKTPELIFLDDDKYYRLLLKERF